MSKTKTPAIHEGNAYNKDIIAMCMPLLAMGTFFYGPRVLLLALIAVVTAKLADRAASMLRARRYDPTENISVAVALIMVLMMPATVQIRVVVMAVLVAVFVGKEAFGGYNSYPFNPAAVGYCVAAVSWPESIFRYPEPQNWFRITDWSLQNLFQIWRFQGTSLLEGPSSTLKNGGLPSIETWSLLFGDYLGPIGTTSCVVILACAVYLCVKKRLPLAAPLSFIATLAIIVFLFPRAPQDIWKIAPWLNWQQRLQSVKFELLSGALVFAAVFLVDEPCTLPKNNYSRIVYGVLLGFATAMFRYFGTYELGACFALLLVNAISGYFDRAIAAGLGKRKGAAKT